VATLATCFRDALSNIEPGDDATNAKGAHEQVSDALRADDWLRQTLGVEPVLIGSYARDVSVRRVKDVDVFARLTKADSGLRPGKTLEHIEALLADEFGDERVERQYRSIKVEFPEYDLSVDVVPARPCGDHWEIPEKTEDDTNASWVETNPTKMTDLKTEANAEFLLYDDDAKSGVYVRIVKLMRQIRRTWIEDQPGGFYFEVLTYWAFQEAQPNEDTIADYLVVILNKAAELLATAATDGLKDPTLDDRTIATKATDDQLAAAAERIGEAADLAERALNEPDKCRSAKLWLELLGTTKNTSEAEDVFPLPSYCNPDGTTKSSRTITRGASTVPAGSDRYA
jgi:hypothetical protein